MAKGTNAPNGQDNISNWFNLSERQAETISFFLNIIVVGFACFGAAASAWLAIPSLLKLIPYEISPLISGTGYLLSVVSGITYAKAQFWDRSYKKIRQWLLGHESENQEEEEKHKNEIRKDEDNIQIYLKNQRESLAQDVLTKNTLIELIKELYKLEHKVQDENLPELSDILHSLSNKTGLTKEQFNYYFQNDLKHSKKDKLYDSMDYLTNISLEVVKLINWFIALNVILAGSAIAIILTTLGSKNAIFSIFSDIFGASTLTGTMLWAPAIFISVFTQICKLILNSDRQMAELDWFGFTKIDLDHDVKYLQEKSKLLHRFSHELKHINSEIESAKKLANAHTTISRLENRVQELTNAPQIKRSDSSTQTQDEDLEQSSPREGSFLSYFQLNLNRSSSTQELAGPNAKPGSAKDAKAQQNRNSDESHFDVEELSREIKNLNPELAKRFEKFYRQSPITSPS